MSQADVVRAPLQHGRAKRRRLTGRTVVLTSVAPEPRQDLLDRWDVLVEELLLQVDGVRRDDDALAILGAVERGRDEVGERLAGSRAGLDQQLLALIERARDRASHLRLLGPGLEALQDLRHRTVGSECRVDLIGRNGQRLEPWLQGRRPLTALGQEIDVQGIE